MTTQTRKKKKPLEGLGKGRDQQKLAKKKKTAAVRKKKKSATEVLGGPYTHAEYLRWAEKWPRAKGLPLCARIGRACDGWYGVAIFHSDNDEILVSHFVTQKRADRDAYVAGLVHMAKMVRKNALKKNK